jgi:predicted MFS family arabinose efflux permease
VHRSIAPLGGGDGRLRVLASFAAFGAFWGGWGAVLPDVQAHAHADDGELGIALLCVGVGALLSMRIVGTMLDRSGPLALPATLLGLAVAGVLPGVATSALALGAVLLAMGAASGAVDVAINTAGVRTEAATGRAILNLAHGMFSAGVVVGSLGAGGLRAAGASAVVVGPAVVGLVAEATTLPAGLAAVGMAAAALTALAGTAPGARERRLSRAAARTVGSTRAARS